jgi:uncharacterized protein (TIGR03790 family)
LHRASRLHQTSNVISLLRLTLLVCLSLAPGPCAIAQTARNVLVVVNESSPASTEIGEYYVRARGVPADQVVRVAVDPVDEVSRADYQSRIETPVSDWLGRQRAHDRILFIVLTKGVPLRVAGTTGRTGTVASVDSELALLYRRLTGVPVPPQGATANPYYTGGEWPGPARPFTHEDQDIFLVTRLDGFTVAEVKALIDRGIAPASEGRVVLDMRAAWEDAGNTWLKAAADRLGTLGLGEAVHLETTSEVVTGARDVIGYWSWGSNDPAVKQRRSGLHFVPGAIAGLFVSTDARTFTPPPDEWMFGIWDRPRTYYAGSPQSLAGDLIRDGVTGLSAYEAEPFLDGTVRPDVLFPAYFSGYTLAEAYYLATPSLGWQTVVIGDPLCTVAPSKRPAVGPTEPEADADTEHGPFFSRRWVASAERDPEQGVLNRDALKLALKAVGRLLSDDKAGGQEAAEAATALEPRLRGLQLRLATIYDEQGHHEKAAERYRMMLAVRKDDWAALNNLAYHLATREHKPGDALPLAERAYLTSRGSPVIADTLAWIHHLMGNRAQAGRYIAIALRGAGDTAEIRYHAAAILESAGQTAAARRELDKALELDPKLAEREEVQTLRAAVAKGK